MYMYRYRHWVVIGVFAVLLAGVSGTDAAAVKGMVTDTLTKAPVESVLVQIEGTAVRVYSDAAGRFTLNNVTAAVGEAGSSLSLRQGWTKATDIQVYNAKGSIIAEKEPAARTGAFLSGLSNGLHVVRVRHDDRWYTMPLSKTGGRVQTAEYNRLNGGSYTVYGNADMVVTNSIFGRADAYGAHTDDCGVWTFNVWEDTGASIN